MKSARIGDLVGRAGEMAAIRAHLEDAIGSRGRLILLWGEPGIGKTYLADRGAAVAREMGFGVARASGRASEGAPAFWPWIEVLRSDAMSGVVPAADMARELEGHSRPSRAVRALDVADARFRLFDRTHRALVAAASRRPLMLVLDDWQWADHASQRLLAFLEPRLVSMPLLALATWRDEGGGPAFLAELSADVVSLPLTGLSPDETAELAEATASAPVRPALSRAIHDRSSGNPLFTKELTRLLGTQGRLDSVGLTAVPHAVPATIRAVLERRLERLSTGCRRLLSCAAVLGDGFTTETLTRVAEDTEGVSELLDEARAAGVVDVAGDRWSFVHALVRETVYAGMPSELRAALHGRAADVLEGNAPAGELARHLRLCGSRVREAVEHTRLSAGAAMERMAYEDAIAEYRDAVALPGFQEVDASLRAELMLGLGEAHMRLGETDQARAAFMEAAECARSAVDAELLSRAALGYGTLVQFEGFAGADHTCARLVEEALAALPAGPTPLRVRLLVRLAGEVSYSDPDRAAEIRRLVEDLASTVDDAASKARVMWLRHGAWMGRPVAADRRVLAQSTVQLAQEAGDFEYEVNGRAAGVADSFELGDIPAVEAEIAAVLHRGTELHLKSWLWFPALWRATLAMLEGRLDRADELAAEALSAGASRGNEAVDHYGIQLLFLRREQGRLEELEPLVRAAVDRYPYLPSYRCVLALMDAEAGRTASARAELKRLATDGFAVIRPDFNFTISAALLAETCAVLADATAAEALYERLAGFADFYVNVGLGALCYGSVSRFLALLQLTRGRDDEAAALFEHAIAQNERIGSVPAAARCRYEYGSLLTRRGGAHDLARAAELLDSAAEAAEDLGLIDLRDRLSRLRVPHRGTSETNTFRLEGEVWHLTFEGRSVRFKDSKGLRDIAVLLGRPGTEVHALDLAAPWGGTARTEPDELVDDAARTSYKARLAELRDEIAEAERFGDVARAERNREALEELTAELGRAYGLSGRPRRMPTDAERARKAVSARVRDAVRRIADEHPALGRHLEQSVRTGTFCAYMPAEPVSWRL